MAHPSIAKSPTLRVMQVRFSAGYAEVRGEWHGIVVEHWWVENIDESRSDTAAGVFLLDDKIARYDDSVGFSAHKKYSQVCLDEVEKGSRWRSRYIYCQQADIATSYTEEARKDGTGQEAQNSDIIRRRRRSSRRHDIWKRNGSCMPAPLDSPTETC